MSKRLTIIALLSAALLLIAVGIWQNWSNLASTDVPAKEATPAFSSGTAPAPASTLDFSASVSVGKDIYKFKPNSIGNYPRVHVPANACIPIHLDLSPGEPIGIQVLDGGQLDDKTAVRSQTSDASGNIDFQYQVMSSPGSYRVAVYHNGQRFFFDFWVGPDLPQRVSAQQQ